MITKSQHISTDRCDTEPVLSIRVPTPPGLVYWTSIPTRVKPSGRKWWLSHVRLRERLRWLGFEQLLSDPPGGREYICSLCGEMHKMHTASGWRYSRCYAIWSTRTAPKV